MVYLCAHSFCIFSIIFHYRGLRLFLFICITAITIHQISVVIILLLLFTIYVFCSSTPTIFSETILFSQSVAVRCLALFPQEIKNKKKENITTYIFAMETDFDPSISISGFECIKKFCIKTHNINHSKSRRENCYWNFTWLIRKMVTKHCNRITYFT